MRAERALYVASIFHACSGFILCPAPTAGRVVRSASSTALAGIYTTISDDMKTAMKAKETAKLAALRNIRAAFLKETKESGGSDTLADDKCVAVLRKLSKMRKESIEMYAKGGRQELVDKETTELNIIEQFLPQLADEATMKQWAVAAIEKTGAKAPSDMGKVMGVLMKEHKEEMDGKIAQKLVTELLKS